MLAVAFLGNAGAAGWPRPQSQLRPAASPRLRPNADVPPPIGLAHGSTVRASAAQPYAGCIRNSGRPCEQALPNSSIVDYLSQCYDRSMTYIGDKEVLQESERCSRPGGDWPGGVCICNPGWCADDTTKCKKETNKVFEEGFYITTEALGNKGYLYMEPGGLLKTGSPPSWELAQWRVAMTAGGVYYLYTMASEDHLLDAFDQCSERTDPLSRIPYSQCMSVVGHVSKPSASETGWYIDRFEDGNHVALRSMHGDEYLYIDPVAQTGRACKNVQDLEDCPGPWGKLMFSPPITSRFDFVFSEPPATSFHRFVHYSAWALAVIVVLCLCCINTRFDSKTSRFDDNCCGQCSQSCAIL